MATTGLHQGLKQRHLTMIAIGGVIGAGLFVGSGVVINEAGPGAFLTYGLMGVQFSSCVPVVVGGCWPSCRSVNTVLA